jgi:hypothetical protein
LPPPSRLTWRCDVSVSSADELFESLNRVKANPELRHALVTRGNERARDFTAERITECWQHYLDEVALPAYREWLQLSRSSRWLYYLKCCARWPFDFNQRRRIRKDWFR